MNMHTHSSGRERRARHSCGKPAAAAVLCAVGVLAAAGTAGAQVIDVNTWANTNTARAMKLEREIMADMPANQAVRIGTHNSFNADRYTGPGYPVFQHTYMLFEQLELGVRTLDLDIHQIAATPRLMVSHAQCLGGGYVVGEASLDEMLLEIRIWLDQRPDEVIYIFLEQHIFATNETPWHLQMLDSFERYLGNLTPNDRIYRPSEVGGSVNLLLAKSTNDIRAAGKRVVIINQGGSSEPCSSNTLPNYNGSNINNVVHRDGVGGYIHCMAEASLTEQRGWYYVTAREFRGDYESPLDRNENGIADPLEIKWGDFVDLNHNLIIDLYEQQYYEPGCIGARMGRCTDEDKYRQMYVHYSNSSCGETGGYGIATTNELREAVRSGFNVLRLDPLGKSMSCGLPVEFSAKLQLESTMWSWTPFSVPPVDSTPRVAMAVVEVNTARIYWTTPTTALRYAMQDDFGEWSISPGSGTFAQAPADTTTPEPDFRAPGNGFEMQNLFGAMIRAGVTRVLVNYHDLDGNGVWTSKTRPRKLAYNSPRPLTSPVPAVVGDGPGLRQVIINETSTPPSGRVVPLLLGPYFGAYQLDRPMTVVPAIYGQPVSVGG